MKTLSLLFTVIICCSLSSSISAKSWRVSNVDPTADFSSLDEAMTGISAGDVLYLEGSPTAYTLNSIITKKVTIIGPGYFLTQNPNTLVNKSIAHINSTIKIRAAGVILEGLTIINSNSVNSVVIGEDNVIIRRCYLEGILFSDENSNSTPLQINNTVITQNYITHRMTNDNLDYAYNAVVTNNIFVTQSTSYISYLRRSIIENNTIRSSVSVVSNSDCSIKNNILNTNVSVGSNPNSTISNNYMYKISDFITSSSADGEWQLLPESPGMTAGTNGSQCGAFGGASPYVLSGLASIPHIYEIDAPTAASETSGLNVTIKIGSEK